jgi:hypothetical protein
MLRAFLLGVHRRAPGDHGGASIGRCIALPHRPCPPTGAAASAAGLLPGCEAVAVTYRPRRRLTRPSRTVPPDGQQRPRTLEWRGTRIRQLQRGLKRLACRTHRPAHMANRSPGLRRGSPARRDVVVAADGPEQRSGLHEMAVEQRHPPDSTRISLKPSPKSPTWTSCSPSMPAATRCDTRSALQPCTSPIMIIGCCLHPCAKAVPASARPALRHRFAPEHRPAHR